jgi:hypothetical protein
LEKGTAEIMSESNRKEGLTTEDWRNLQWFNEIGVERWLK